MVQILIPVFITVTAVLLILSYQQAFATDTIISSNTTLSGVAEGDTVIINPGVKVRATGEIAGTLINNQPTGVVYGGQIAGTESLTFNNCGIIACNVEFDPPGSTSYIGNRPICDATLFANQGMQLFEGNSLSDEVLSLNQPLRVVALHNTLNCLDPNDPVC